MRIHVFASSEEAYDDTQTEEHISDLDLLVVPSEGIVGFLWEAWPVAITREGGCFHRLNDPKSPPTEVAVTFNDACDVARVAGYRLEGHKALPCTCEWADDDGNLDVGPDPYISQIDEECPQHGRIAEPELWSQQDDLDAAYDAYVEACDAKGYDENLKEWQDNV